MALLQSFCLCVCLCGGLADEKKAGTVVGVVTAKQDNWIEVKADGEEKARRYVPHWRGGLPKDGGGPDKKMVQVIRETKVGSRVRLEWEFEERARVVKIEVLQAPTEAKGEADKKTGTVTGKATDKGDRWIEIKADGEEKGRKYYLLGAGTPEQVKALKDTPTGSRVRLEWNFHERPRIVKLEVLKK